MYTHHAYRRGVRLFGTALVVPLVLAGPAGAMAGPSTAPALPVALRATAPTVALAGGPQPFLAGLSSQDEPVLLRFSADRRILTRAQITLHLTCTAGGSFWTPDRFQNLTVSSLGSFRITYTLPPEAIDATMSMAVSGAFKGKVDRTGTRVSGTWQATEVETNPTTNAVTDTCTTGVVRFSAHR